MRHLFSHFYSTSVSIGSSATRCLSSGGGFTSAIFSMPKITSDRNNDKYVSANDDNDQFRIGYLSDIDGHWEYFLECVHRSLIGKMRTIAQYDYHQL